MKQMTFADAEYAGGVLQYRAPTGVFFVIGF